MVSEEKLHHSLIAYRLAKVSRSPQTDLVVLPAASGKGADAEMQRPLPGNSHAVDNGVRAMWRASRAQSANAKDAGTHTDLMG